MESVVVSYRGDIASIGDTNPGYRIFHSITYYQLQIGVETQKKHHYLRKPKIPKISHISQWCPLCLTDVVGFDATARFSDDLASSPPPLAPILDLEKFRIKFR
jgi:hypothetical protein